MTILVCKSRMACARHKPSALSCRAGHQAKLSRYTPMEIEIAVLLRGFFGETLAYASE